LAAGLRPNPLGELDAPPDLLAAIGGLLLRGGDGMGQEGKGQERREREGKKTPMNVGWLRACSNIEV